MTHDALRERVARAIHTHLCRRDIMQYLDNPEDCDALAQAALDATPLAEMREALRDAEAAIVRVVEGDGGMEVATAWAPDGKPSKHDRCEHGRWMYEGCENCAASVLLPALTSVRAALGGGG